VPKMPSEIEEDDMKYGFMLICCALVVLSGCKSPLVSIGDREFVSILSHPRHMERFHYAGSVDGIDYFVGEQWEKSPDRKSAGQSVVYHRVMNSKYAKTRFPLTTDITKWVDVKPF
jgi:hypothetical protein